MPEATVYDTLLQLSQQIGELTAKVDAFIDRSDAGDDVLKTRLDDAESEIDALKKRVNDIETKAGSVALKIVTEVLKYIGMAALGVVAGVLLKGGQ